MDRTSTAPANRGWLVRWIELVQRHPKSVLTLAVGLAVAGAVYAWFGLSFRTERTDLLDPNGAVMRDFERIRTEFDHENDMLVVVEADSKSRRVAAIERIAANLTARPELFAKVLYRIDATSLRAKGLFQLPVSALKSIEEQIEPFRPLISGGPGGLFVGATWAAMSLESALAETAVGVVKLRPGETPPPEFEKKAAGVAATLRSMASYLSDPNATYQSPWRGDEKTPAAPAGLAEIPDYIASTDGRLLLLKVLPARDVSSFTGVGAPVAALRTIAAEVQKAMPGVTVGLTGLPILEDDEMQTALNASTWASLLEIVGVLAVFAVGFRAMRHPIFVLAGVLLSGGWTLGFVTLTIGHLNILSMTFIVTLIGMGVDFGVVWLARYEGARTRGSSVAESNAEAAHYIGPGIIHGALTTVLAFYATVLTKFVGMREMGWIAGTGIIFCLIAALTVLPAMLALWSGAALSPRRGARDLEPAFPQLIRRPKLVLAVSCVVVVILGIQSFRVKGDFNLLHLQANGLPSVAWEHRLINEMGVSGWHAQAMAESPDEARRLKAKFESLPTVGRVVEIATLIPEDAKTKQASIRRIHDLLRSLPAVLPGAPAPNASGMTRILETISKVGPAGSVGELRKTADAAKTLVTSSPDAARRMAEFQKLWRRDLFEQLQRLFAASDPVPPTVADLPPSLCERLHGRTGKWQLQIFPKGESWDLEPLTAFVADLKSVDPHVSGEPVTALHGVEQMIESFEWSAVFAGVIIFGAVWIDLKSLRATLLACTPLMLGCVLTFGAMAWLGIAFNPANLIALPLILGMGVDFGVHVMHDYRHSTGPYSLNWQFARALVLTTATTIIGFSSLFVSGHWGMISIGIVLTLGVAASSALALICLPAFLSLYPLPRTSYATDEQDEPVILQFPKPAYAAGRRAA